MSVRRALLPALTSLLLLLTGCGGGQSTADPPVLPPTSSATSQPPEPETPEHFIRRWAAEEARMENTGNTKAYLAISRECRACRALAHQVARFYAAGGFVKWSGWKILSIRVGPGSSRSRVFNVAVESGPTVYRESSSGALRHLPGGRATHQLTVDHAGGRWRVTFKAQLAS